MDITTIAQDVLELFLSEGITLSLLVGQAETAFRDRVLDIGRAAS